MDRLLIVGLDPGTTTGYAILDDKGSVLAMKSSKALSMDHLLAEVTSYGKVLLVGTDVRFSPQFVEKFCSRVGAKLVSPGRDLKQGFKETVVKGHPVKDDHQRDALAAALLAYHKVKDLFAKVDRVLAAQGKSHHAYDVKRLVLDGINIAEALALLEQNQVQTIKKKRKRIEAPKVFHLVEENIFLRAEHDELLRRVHSLEQQLATAKQEMHAFVEQRVKKNFALKEANYRDLLRQLQEERNQQQILRQDLERLTRILRTSDDYVFALHVPNLRIDSLEQAEPLSPVLVVDDPTMISERSLTFLKERVSILACRKIPPRSLTQAGFRVLLISDITEESFPAFSFLKKSDVLKNPDPLSSLQHLVDEYREKRQKERR